MTADPSTEPRAGGPSGPSGPLIGTVAGRGVGVDLLDARIGALYAGRAAGRLPRPGSPEALRLRRYLAQLLLTEHLVTAEAARLGIADPPRSPAGTDPAVPPAASSPPSPVPSPAPSRSAAPPNGSLVSAVLAAMPLAGALYRQVTAGVTATEAEARAYHRRNADRWHHPERRRLLHLLVRGRGPVGPGDLDALGGRFTCTRSDLPEPLASAAFTAALGDVVGPLTTPFGSQVCRIEEVLPAGTAPFDAVRQEILTLLTRQARTRYFERWMDRRRSELVTTTPGYEHPGDPRHPGYTHHH